MALTYPEEFWLLALHTLPGVRMARVAHILQVLQERNAGPEAFFRSSPEEWHEDFELPTPVLQYLQERLDHHLQQTLRLWQKLKQWKVSLLSWADASYPPEVRQLPYRVPLLYLHGPLKLLAHRPRIAFLNSRFIRPKVEAFLRQVAEAVLQALPFAVVTSPFRTAYRASAEVAVAQGVPLILVGDRGILFLLQSPWIQRISVPRLILTPFAPEDVGTPGSGMVRDDLIGALADVLVGCEIYRGGNMERQFQEALKAGKAAFVWQREGRDLANADLARQGARPFQNSEELVARLRDELGL